MSPRFAWAIFALAAIAALAPRTSSETGSTIPTAELPAGTMQAKATTACTECHEARIILQQRLSKAAWTREVDKMIKWGAVVDPSDRNALIDYFGSNFGPDQPVYTPSRSASHSQNRPQNR